MDVSFLKKCLNSIGKEDLVVILIEFEMSHIKIKLSKILALIRALLHKKLKPRLTFNPRLTFTPSRKIRPWALRTMTHALEVDRYMVSRMSSVLRHHRNSEETRKTK